jgi:DNA-binding NarL/FixJ family response regulator
MQYSSLYCIQGGDMNREIRVLLAEDDFYARNWMEMLLRRDLRTKLVGEVSEPAGLSAALEDINRHRERVDLILVDTDIPQSPRWLTEVIRNCEKYSPKTAILFTGCVPNAQVARLRTSSNFVGYILKEEIRYSLAWAVSLADKERIVITPGVFNFFDKNYTFPSGSLMLDGREPIANFSKRELERARMAFIYSMERHEMAHELGISEEFSYGVVSALYDKLGLDDVLDGRVDPEQYFGSHPAVINYLKLTLEHLKRTGSKKAKNKETLAFHLFTMPDIQEIF